jgi:hypothetical protein
MSVANVPRTSSLTFLDSSKEGMSFDTGCCEAILWWGEVFIVSRTSQLMLAVFNSKGGFFVSLLW